jgi:hypothetical protein
VSDVREAALAAAQARIAVDAARDAGPQYWAEIEKPATGETFRKTTRDERIARGWMHEPRLRVLRFGTGVAPWEQAEPGSAPAAPPTPLAAEPGPGVVPGARATGATCLGLAPTAEPTPTPRDTVEAFKAATSTVVAPAQLSPVTTPAAGAAAPSASPEVVAIDSHNLDQVIAQVLAVLEHDQDLRIRKHSSRVVAYLAERRAGVRLAKRDQAALVKPF